MYTGFQTMKECSNINNQEYNVVSRKMYCTGQVSELKYVHVQVIYYVNGHLHYESVFKTEISRKQCYI